jgi:DNA (cytosine-5)-methyltransferase 1
MLNVLSLFSGIGAFEKALDNLGIEYNLLAYCEIDKFASKSYSLIHNVSEEKNLKDVTKVDFLDIEDRVDLITYGFPCQDISNAGKGKGFIDENGERTRSGLFFEALRIIDEFKPKFAIAENVKALTSKKFSNEFKTVLDSLEEIGYNNYYQVLNAKDYGIPQNRERVFIISIRKDIDKGFTFPDPIPLELRLKDMLDDEVEEKFYLSDKQITRGLTTSYKSSNLERRAIEQEGIMTTLLARDYKDPKCVRVREATKKGYAEATIGDSVNLEQPNSKTRRGRVGKEVAQTLTTSCNQAVVVDDVVRLGGIFDSEKSTHQAGSIYDKNGVAPTLDTMQGGYRQPMITEENDDIDDFLNS